MPLSSLVRVIGRDVAIKMGAPQDIEWAIADGKLYILQARPEWTPMDVIEAVRNLWPGEAG